MFLGITSFHLVLKIRFPLSVAANLLPSKVACTAKVANAVIDLKKIAEKTKRYEHEEEENRTCSIGA